MRGLAMVGALFELSRAGWLHGIRHFAGTSVGAIIAAGLAIGVQPRTIWSKVLAFTYTPAIDLTQLDSSFGLDSGAGLDEWIALVLGSQPLTLRDVLERHGSTLLICATNLSTRNVTVFGPKTHPDMSVALALRMSCSVPLYFSAVKHDGDLYVDGALTDNFPIAAAAATNAKKVLGIRVQSTRKTAGHEWTFDQFVGAVVECSLARPIPPSAVVVDIDAGSKTNPLNFAMKRPERQKLFDIGAAHARLFVKKQS